MSASEIATVLLGGFLGYWIVFNLMRSKSKYDPTAHRDSAKTNDNQGEIPGVSDSSEQWFHVLNISPGASLDEIQTAYRYLIRQYHPDKVASLGIEFQLLAEEKAKRINLAYQQALKEKES